MDLTQLSINELSEKLQKREITSRELTEAFIKNIEERDPEINAFITKTFDVAREMADSADSRYEKGEPLSLLDGIPMTLKDVVCTVEAPTTAASKILEHFTSPYDATVWERLKKAGAVLLGKVNTDEFTMGGSTETSYFGVTKNPHDPTRVSGGSSGGSAAAVAANMCAYSIGTDTGGSIRQPASFCGCTGLKVSYGRVSRWGVIPMASSLDTVGVLAKSPEDTALVMEVIAGQDPKDSTTPPVAVPAYHKELQPSLKNLTIGIPKEYFTEGLDPEIQQIIDSTKEILKSLGVEVKEVSLPHTKYAAATYYIIAPSEISANMARFDGIRFGYSAKKDTLEDIYTYTREEGFGAEVKRRILIGTYTLSAGYYDAYYRKAQKVRTLIKQDFEKAFEEVDALLAPVSPTPAFPIGAKKDPLSMYLEDILTIPASLAGITGLSIPMGKTKSNLPLGVQILGKAFDEALVLRIGHHLYQYVHQS